MENDRGLKLLLTALPLLTGWLYLVGLAHHQSYLSFYGAHYSLFDLSFEGALVSGFISVFTLSFPAMLYALLILAAFVFALSIAAAVSLNRRPRVFLTKLLKRLKHKKEPTKVVPEIGKALDGALSLNSFLGAVVAILMLLGASVLLGQKSGETSAKRDMVNFSSGKIEGLMIDGVRTQIVKCNENFCLVWDGSKSTQVPRDKLNSVSMSIRSSSDT